MQQFGLRLPGGVNVVPQRIVFMPHFLTSAPPTPKSNKAHTRIQTDFGVTRPDPPPPRLFSPSLSLPLPTQACDVAVSDNEVRILLRYSVRMTEEGLRCSLPPAPSADS